MATDLNCMQLTLTSAATAYNLHTLMAAIDTDIPIRACEVVIQADSANAAVVYVGDENISATRFGYAFAAGGTTSALVLGNSRSVVSLKSIYFWSVGAAGKVNVTVLTA